MCAAHWQTMSYHAAKVDEKQSDIFGAAIDNVRNLTCTVDTARTCMPGAVAVSVNSWKRYSPVFSFVK